MKSIKVKHLMVPLDEYATVDENATLNEAVLALEESQKRFRQDRYKHRAVLVFDKGHNKKEKLCIYNKQTLRGE